MRISDWSSDVCSSDLRRLGPLNTLGNDRLANRQREIILDQRRRNGRVGLDIDRREAVALPRRHVDDRDHRPAPAAATPFGITGLLRSLARDRRAVRSEAHPSALQSLIRLSYYVFCLITKTTQIH